MIYKKLGFKTYRDYLRSDLFQDIRKKVFEIYGNECCCCLGKATQIHHIKYTWNNMRGANYKYLVPLCGGCHHKIEFNKKGLKIKSTRSVELKLNRMMHKKKARRILEIHNAPKPKIEKPRQKFDVNKISYSQLPLRQKIKDKKTSKPKRKTSNIPPVNLIPTSAPKLTVKSSPLRAFLKEK